MILCIDVKNFVPTEVCCVSLLILGESRVDPFLTVRDQSAQNDSGDANETVRKREKGGEREKVVTSERIGRDREGEKAIFLKPIHTPSVNVSNGVDLLYRLEGSFFVVDFSNASFK